MGEIVRVDQALLQTAGSRFTLHGSDLRSGAGSLNGQLAGAAASAAHPDAAAALEAYAAHARQQLIFWADALEQFGKGLHEAAAAYGSTDAGSAANLNGLVR